MGTDNKSLYVIVNEAVQIEQMLIQSNGEITEEIENALMVRDVSLPEKVDGYSVIMERFEALENHYKIRADFFAKIAKQCAAVQDRLKNSLKDAMTELGTVELKGNDIKFKLTPTSGKLIVDDAEMIPVEFKQEVVTTEIDKKALKEALMKELIPGAHLEEGFSLRMYANTPDKKSKKAVVS